MSHGNAAAGNTASQATSQASRSDWQTLREAVALFLAVADRYAKRRLLLALTLVAGAALLAALTPIALKLALDALAEGARGQTSLAPAALVALYVLGQYLVRCFTELRMLMHGQAEQRVRRHIGRKLFEHIDAHAVLTDSLINYETVKYFDAEPVVCGRYDKALSQTESAWRRFFRRRTMNALLVATIFAFSLGVSLIYATHDVLRGAMTIGGFVLVNTYVVRLVQPPEMLGFAVRDIAQGLAFLGRMLELFRETTEGDLLRGQSHASEMRGELAFDQVSFSYHQDRAILKNVSFRVPAGRTVAVVGVSGSGKSSMIRLLFRLYEPQSGSILLDGRPIAQMPLSAVRQAIAVVPQDTVLFHDTIANNIGFGRCGSSRDEIEEAARVAHLHEFILGLPEGYETVVGERGLKLSGGERQRVAIARAALKRPRIFVFDEATSSLDSATEREILRNLFDVSSKRTTLVIAHRLSTIVHADEILVLDNAVIIERGTHDELREGSGAYAALWRAQQGGNPIREEFRTSAA